MPDLTRRCLSGNTVHIDGSASRDADGDDAPLPVVVDHRAEWVARATWLDPEAGPAKTLWADLPGTYVAQLIVHDGTVDSSPDTMMITTANRPPVLASIGNRTVGLGRHAGPAAHGDGILEDPLTFSVAPLPANASLNTTTGRFTFTPGANQVGTLSLTFKVSDGKLTDEKPITVTVVECHATTITAVDLLTGPVGTEVTITGTNLNCGTAQTLTLNGAPAVITSLSPTQIKTSIPLSGEGGLLPSAPQAGRSQYHRPWRLM